MTKSPFVLITVILAICLVFAVVWFIKPMKLSLRSITGFDEATILAFSSDAHVSYFSDGTTKDDSAVRAGKWIEAIEASQGQIAWMGFCGDCGSAGADSSTDYWKYVQHLMDNVEAQTQGIYTTGNHEFTPGEFTTASSAAKDRFTRIGEAVDENNFSIYCFGANGGSQQIEEADIVSLKNYLEIEEESKPIFILSHFPLHNGGGRSTANADKVLALLNGYPNVIFLWGHNHTVAGTDDGKDTHFDRIFTGYTGTLDGDTAGFTYAAAGCMGDSEYGVGSHSVVGKGLVAKVADDGTSTTLQYYDANGSAIGQPVTIATVSKTHDTTR